MTGLGLLQAPVDMGSLVRSKVRTNACANVTSGQTNFAGITASIGKCAQTETLQHGILHDKHILNFFYKLQIVIEIREYLIEIRACFTTSPKLDRDGCSL